MNEKSIESKDASVTKLFNDFYDVPDYQREYVWGEGEETDDENFSNNEDPVYRLMDDIYQASPLMGKTGENDEYFIGAIIVCKADDSKDGIVRYQLIDGQQRVTTLFVILLAMRDLFNEHLKNGGNEKGLKTPESLKKLIFDAKSNDKGDDVERLKLSLQYEDASGVLDNLYNSQHDAISLKTGSSRRIYNSYKKSLSFLRTNCNDYGKLKQYFGFFQGRVKLVRIETPSVNKALEIFETINERGVGLSPLDLLKNLMFMNSSKEDFDSLKDDWKVLGELIEKSEPTKPMRFLRYFYNADYATSKEGIVREKDIYSSFKRNADRIDYQKNPRSFVKKMISTAEVYNKIRNGLGPDGTPIQSLNNLLHLGRSTFRQHYSLLLAGRNLKDCYSDFADIVERIVTVSYFAGVQPNVQERNMAELAIEARKLKSKADLEKFKTLCETKMITPSVINDFTKSFMNLTQDDLVVYRLKYILARLSQFIEKEIYGEEGRSDLSEFLPKTNNIEHILPQNGKIKAYAEFLETTEKEISAKEIQSLKQDYVPMLGNLTLLLEETNKSAGGNKYSKKIKKHYPNDKWTISKFIADKPNNSINGRAVKAFEKNLELFPDWTPEAMERRQAMYTRIAHRIWRLPQPEGALKWSD